MPDIARPMTASAITGPGDGSADIHPFGEGRSGAAPSPADAILPLGVRGLCYRAGGRPLVGPVDLDLHHGVKTAILGPNGAGKSVLLRLMHGLLTPTAGTIRWNGRIADAGILRRQAMVFQTPVLLRRSVAENIAYVLRLRGWPRAQRATRVGEMLALGRLGDFARVPARVLSGGEKQRLALVRALAARPEVLFLDEPTASLDPASTAAIEAIVERAAAAGTKIVLVTHDIAQARRLADEVVFLDRGRLVERSAAFRFFARPASPEAAAFLAGDLLY